MTKRRDGESDLRTVMGMIAHDMRSPITAILCAVDMLGSPDLTVEERHSLQQTIRRNGRRLRALATQLAGDGRSTGAGPDLAKRNPRRGEVAASGRDRV